MICSVCHVTVSYLIMCGVPYQGTLYPINCQWWCLPCPRIPSGINQLWFPIYRYVACHIKVPYLLTMCDFRHIISILSNINHLWCLPCQGIISVINCVVSARSWYLSKQLWSVPYCGIISIIKHLWCLLYHGILFKHVWCLPHRGILSQHIMVY